MTTAQDDGKVVSLTYRPPLAPRKYCWYSFLLRLCRLQGYSAIGRIMSMKNPLIPAGIEPATFRFVAQHLNHCATVVPRAMKIKWIMQIFTCQEIKTYEFMEVKIHSFVNSSSAFQENGWLHFPFIHVFVFYQKIWTHTYNRSLN